MEAVLFRIGEVASVLGLVLALILAKHIPFLDWLPLSQATGVVCFTFAIYLSLKLYRAELERLETGD
jgi:hypothetical protein